MPTEIIVQDIKALQQVVKSIVESSSYPRFRIEVWEHLQGCMAEMTEAEQYQFLRRWLKSHGVDPDQAVRS
jgi:hypothetical protein